GIPTLLVQGSCGCFPGTLGRQESCGVQLVRSHICPVGQTHCEVQQVWPCGHWKGSSLQPPAEGDAPPPPFDEVQATNARTPTIAAAMPILRVMAAGVRRRLTSSIVLVERVEEVLHLQLEPVGAAEALVLTVDDVVGVVAHDDVARGVAVAV